ncbi:MAG: hypothetical protein HC886_12535 [Leptolyngbyaceae cyanobacterium SM1_1_3]|nr:hypothetical protein [Leptolyngbyaceae cyanobacterium SM1_1_3]NJN04108.1 hypothetical protein [Leptolyngbyaceae cyanobacterium RM1_1_2]NJO09631.1 hypothetical protein [Leptolyngbyaceae cyanobacterium SL_1_1]
MSQQPRIVHLDILDTDYIQLTTGDRIPEDGKHRLIADNYNVELLSRQLVHYQYADLDAQGRDDILCKIGTTAELFTPADHEAMDERLRSTGQFFLTQGERQQVVNWLHDELGVTVTCSSS